MQFILHILKTWRRRKYFLQCKIIIKTILWFKAIFGITYFIYWRRRKFILPCFLLRIGERGAIRKILQKKKILILSCTKNYGTPCSEMLKKKKIYSSLFWIKKSWGYSTNWEFISLPPDAELKTETEILGRVQRETVEIIKM